MSDELCAGAGRWLITGAAGHLGGTLLRQILAAGGEAYALLLPGERAAAESPRLHCFTGDVREAASLRPLFAAAGEGGTPFTVLHTAALISIEEELPPQLYAVNVGGTKNVLALCREYGARRLVHVSSVHAIPELPDGQLQREVGHFCPGAVTGGYAKTKAEAAQAVLDAAADGLDAVAVFPSGILGPYDSGRNHLVQMLQDYRLGRLPACIRGGYDFVDVRDVAAGCLGAAARGRAGECYILSGHRCEIRALLAEAGRCCGREPPALLPAALAQLGVPFLETAARLRGTRPLFTRYSLHTLCANCNFSHEKADRELGYSVRPLARTVDDTVAWLERCEAAQAPGGPG